MIVMLMNSRMKMKVVLRFIVYFFVCCLFFMCFWFWNIWMWWLLCWWRFKVIGISRKMENWVIVVWFCCMMVFRLLWLVVVLVVRVSVWWFGWCWYCELWCFFLFFGYWFCWVGMVLRGVVKWVGCGFFGFVLV